MTLNALPAGMPDLEAPALQLRVAEPIGPQIILALRQAIIEMRLKPGEALSEKDIAARYGVSRQPVREAFIKLAEAGLVQVLPSRGTYVVKISLRDVLNARFVREAVDCALVRETARLIDPAGLAAIEALVEDQRTAAREGDFARFYALDEAYHRALAEPVECEFGVRVVESARAQIDRVRYLSLPEATPLSRLIDQHTAILEGLKQRDADRAENAMRAHLREILNAIPRLAARFPDLFDASRAPAHAGPSVP
ncbi:MAG: GntR family transcriptional regulator [Beijerinckiaceae bacterium]